MDWEIQGLAKFCQHCQTEFRDGDKFHSFLVVAQDGLPARNDFCETCDGQDRFNEASQPDLYSHWQGQAKIVVTPPRTQPLPYEKFELLLRKYIVSKESRDQKFSYILALLLERKKILISCDSVQKDEMKKFLVYEHAHTAESFILEDPHLSLDQVEEVQKELKGMMDEEFQFETGIVA